MAGGEYTNEKGVQVQQQGGVVHVNRDEGPVEMADTSRNLP